MIVTIRGTQELWDKARADLRRPSSVSGERIGFVLGRSAESQGRTTIILCEYLAVPDSMYERDSSVGARIGSSAIRMVMQRALDGGLGVFHVHRHEHVGVPSFSSVDLQSLAELAPCFARLVPAMCSGGIVLSNDCAAASIWVERKRTTVQRVMSIGVPLQDLSREASPKIAVEDSGTRQAFLGRDGLFEISRARVGIIGLGGGGSHVAQQLAHIGFREFVLIDPDEIESSNLERLVGAGQRDVERGRPKVDIAEHAVKRIRPDSNVFSKRTRWQEAPKMLAGCDLVFGCVDGFLTRRELEVFCRRYLVPYIDIGLDVHTVDGEPPQMAGQVILSIAGHPCMHCIGFLTEEVCAREAAAYGDAGPRPQVIWGNGVLASSAVGISVQLLTSWAVDTLPFYISYDGNRSELRAHIRWEYVRSKKCQHFGFTRPSRWLSGRQFDHS